MGEGEEVDVGVAEGVPGDGVAAEAEGGDGAHEAERVEQVLLGDSRVEIAGVERSLRGVRSAVLARRLWPRRRRAPRRRRKRRRGRRSSRGQFLVRHC